MRLRSSSRALISARINSASTDERPNLSASVQKCGDLRRQLFLLHLQDFNQRRGQLIGGEGRVLLLQREVLPQRGLAALDFLPRPLDGRLIRGDVFFLGGTEHSLAGVIEAASVADRGPLWRRR